MADCDNCGAPLRIDPNRGLFICDHCGSQMEAPPGLRYLDLLAESTTSCPLCSSALWDTRLEGHPLLACRRCYGMLIEMSRFAAVIDVMRTLEPCAFRAVLPPRQHPADRVLTCPTCRQPMLSHFYGGPGNVVIDTCEPCGVNWLDPGELRRIAVAPYSPYSR